MDGQDRPGSDIFEELWLLRACYPNRSDFDTRGTLTLNDAIAYGERLMRTVHLRQHLGGFGQRHRAA